MKNRVKDLRVKNGLTQDELAECVGVPKRTINTIESCDSDIRVSLAHKLAVKFDVSIEDLFEFDDGNHSIADRALWFSRVLWHVSEDLGKPIKETINIFAKSGLAERVLSGYSVWHTQGYEYMAEMCEEILMNGSK